MGRKIVLHLHTDVRDKKPLPSDIMDGELAINYAASGETLYIKNSEEAIAEFKDDKYYQKQLSEKVDKALPLTYSELVSLRDNSQLMPGQQYRITDYVTTTSQEDTRSAGNVFDIIVTAVDTNKLSELAYATQSTRDVNGYFSNSNLNSWELKYCLDNDTTRFAWADETNGKGVIYWMKDEYSNECPYDFKNIQFKRYILNAADAFATDVVKDGELAAVKEKLNVMSHRIHTSLWYYGEYVTDVYPDAEVGKKYVPFGDIMYNNNGPGVLCPINEANSNWNFTFSDDTGHDNTLTSQGNIHDNVIKNNKFLLMFSEGEGRCLFEEQNNVCLNDIIFIGNDCHSNTFKNDCLSNTFGNNCYYNTFGNGFYSNTFGNGCYSNTFGNNCDGNTFGNSCNSNTFGNYFQYNTFGNICYSNTFGNSCDSNTFGNYCYSNTFGNYCGGNTFGNGCYSNTFGNYCGGNTFGNDFQCSTFGNYIQESQFGDDVWYFSITTQQMTTSPTSSYLKNYIRWLIVENGVRYVNAYVTGSTSSSSYCQNVRICLGIQGVNESNRKTFDITSCINSKLNNVYQPENSQTTSV